MEVFRRRVVFAFDEAEVPDLARQLVEAIRRGWGVRRAAPPVLLLRLSDEADEVARATAPCGSPAGHGTARNLPRLRGEAFVSPSDQPVWLTPKQVADQAGVSAAYVQGTLPRARVRHAGRDPGGMAHRLTRGRDMGAQPETGRSGTENGVNRGRDQQKRPRGLWDAGAPGARGHSGEAIPGRA